MKSVASQWNPLSLLLFSIISSVSECVVPCISHFDNEELQARCILSQDTRFKIIEPQSEKADIYDMLLCNSREPRTELNSKTI